MPKLDATPLAAAALARLLGLTRRRIEQLAADGVLPRDPGGKYPLGPSVRAYAEALRGQRANDAERLRGEREGLVRARRLTAELEYAERKRTLIPTAEATQAIGMAGSLLSNILRGLPSRQAPALAGMRDAVRIEAHLAREIDSALHAYADLIERKSTREAAQAAIARGKGATIGVEWLAARGIPWEPTRPESDDFPELAAADAERRARSEANRERLDAAVARACKK